MALLTLVAQQPPLSSPVETLRLRVEHIHDVPGNAVRGARLLRADSVVHFFEKRSFAPAWKLPSGADQIRKTPTFSAPMRYLVLNPDWTVPPTVLKAPGG